MTAISIDFETYSECDIKTAGGYNYAAHPSTEVICMAWAIDDEDPQLWVLGEAFPEELIEAVNADDLSLEQLALKQNGSLFEETFGLQVVLRAKQN